MKLYKAELLASAYESPFYLTVGIYDDKELAISEVTRVKEKIESLVLRIKSRLGKKYKYQFDYDEEYMNLPSNVGYLIETYIENIDNFSEPLTIRLSEINLNETVTF